MIVQFIYSSSRNRWIMRVIGRSSVGDGPIDHITLLRCKDGTTLSVQASRFHNSTPRSNTDVYKAVEVGFPSVPPPYTWARYCDQSIPNLSSRWRRFYHRWRGYRLPTDAVYGYVPVRLVAEFISDHGGLVAEQTVEAS